MINKVLDAWNYANRNKDYHELELRYKNTVTEDMAKRLSIGGKTSYTVDIITPFEGGQYVTTATFDKPQGESTGRNVLRKTYVAQGVFSLPPQFRISYTIEENVGKSVGTPTLCRAKKRTSKQLGEWRLDVTRVDSINGNISTPLVKRLKERVFMDQGGEFEIELEYEGKGTLTEENILSAARELMGQIDPNLASSGEYVDAINYLAGIIGQPIGRSLKQTINAAISLTKNDYYSTMFPPIGYYATDKAEGVRAMLVAFGGQLHCLTSDGMYKWPTNGEFICDAEFLREENLPNDGGPLPKFKTNADLAGGKFLIFDVIKIGDQILSQEPFSERVKHLDAVAKMVGPLPAVAKKYVRLGPIEQLEQQFRSVLDVPYETDGIIITTSSHLYSDTKNYKWKPLDKCSIDFLARRSKTDMAPYVTKPGKTTYLLFVGINHHMRESLGIRFSDQHRDLFPRFEGGYYPVQFSPAYNKLAYIFWHERDDLDGKIIELVRDDNDEWRLLRVRLDRTQETLGCNDFRIAEATYLNYIDPFDMEHLWAAGHAYFENIAGDDYKAGNSYRRVVISRLIKKYCSDASHVIDMAAGRGADLHRYSEVGVKYLFCADIDQSAITELLRRRYELSRPTKLVKKHGGGVLEPGMPINPKWFVVPSVAKMDISAHCMDFLNSAELNIKTTGECGVPIGNVNAITCNFAFHYFCETEDNITNALNYVYGMLAQGGVFIATVMDGSLVYKKFTGGSRTVAAAAKKYGGESTRLWQLMENGQQKYAIRRDFGEETFAPAGQMIAVKLPFAKEMRQEPLANVTRIIEIAKRMGFSLVEKGNFSDWDAEIAPLGFYQRITPADKEYISIHCYFVLKKK